MKKNLSLTAGFTLLFILGVNAQIIPPLNAGTFVFDTTYFFSFTFKGDCYPSAEYVIFLPDDFIPVATGVEMKLLVSGLTTSPGAVTTDFDTLHVNDYLTFSTDNEYIYFYSTEPGKIRFNWTITGTPTVQGEQYYCTYGVFGSDHCPWYDIFYKLDSCQIGDASGVAQEIDNSGLNVFENPITRSIEIMLEPGIVQHVIFRLYNLEGREVISRSFERPANLIQLPVDNLSKGFYVWKITGNDNIQKTGKLLIN